MGHTRQEKAGDKEGETISNRNERKLKFVTMETNKDRKNEVNKKRC